MAKRKPVDIELRMIDPEHPGAVPLIEMWVGGKRIKSIAPIAIHKLSDEDMAAVKGQTESGNDDACEPQGAFFAISQDGSVKVLSDESTMTEEQKQRNQRLIDAIIKRGAHLPPK